MSVAGDKIATYTALPAIAELSPLSRANQSIMLAALTLMGGSAEDAAEAAASMALDYISAIPVYGQLVSVVAGIVGALSGPDTILLSEKELCEALMTRYAIPPPTGSVLSGCEECPSEIFAPLYDPAYLLSDSGDWTLGNDPGSYRKRYQIDPSKPGLTCSAVGYALITMTERLPLFLSDKWCFMSPTPATLQASANEGYKGETPTISKLRSAIYRVRLAIGRDYATRNAPVRGSDGGIGLWPVWLDLALQLKDLGAMPVALGRWALTCGPLGGKPCPGLANSAVEVVERWRDTVDPNYATGAAALQAVKASLANLEFKAWIQAGGTFKLTPAQKALWLAKYGRQARARR